MILFILILLKISQILGVEEIYLTPNEQLYLQKKSVILQSNVTYYDHINDESIEKQQQFSQISNSLINIHQTYDIDEKVIDIITFADHNQDDQYICLLNQNQIDCKFKLSKMLINDNLVIQQGFFTQVPTIFLQCKKVFNLLQNIYIVQCQNDFGLTFKLLNQNNEIFDTLIIRSKYKEQQQSIQVIDQLIIYEIHQQVCQFSIIRINLEKYHFLLYQFTLDLTQNYNQSGVINNLDFKQHNQIQVFFQYLIIKIDLKSFEIFYISEIPKGSIEYYNVLTVNGNSYYLMLDASQQKTIDFFSNIFQYNLSKGKILKSEIINQNLVLILTNYIIIFNNEYIHLEFYHNYKSINFLIGLPFIIILTQQNNLNVLQINDLPNFIKYSNSQCLSIYQFDYFFKFGQVLQYKVNLYTFQYPQLLTAKVQNLAYVLQEKMFQYSYSSLGLPFSITSENNNQIIKSLINSITIENSQFNEKQLNQKLIIFTTSKTTKYLLLIFGNHNIITIFDQASGLQNNQKISFFSNNSKIFSSISKQNFVIVNNQTMIGFQYQEQLKESWLFRVSLKIIDIVQIGDILAIQLEECNEIKIDLENMIYQQMSQSFQQNCTYSIDNNFFIAIFKNEIKIESAKSLKLTYKFNTLLQHIYFVDIEYLILFELEGTKIIAKLYNLSSQKLNFLYNLPFYDFEIIQPISYKVAKTYLAIIVKNQENQYFAMVFNIKYLATNCLIKVIEIDPNFHQFNFIDQSQIFVQFRNQITVYFLQWVFLHLSNLYFDSNTYYYKQFVVLQKKSDLFSQTQNITVQLIAINTNQQLQIKNQSIPVYYSIKQKNKEIILDNVFGNIDLLVYQNQNGQAINLNPIIIADQYSCLQPFYNQICISQSDQIVLNYFDKQNQVVINLPEITLSQYQFFRKVNNNYELFLAFSNSEGRLYVITQLGQILNNKTISIRQVFPDSLPSDASLNVVGNFGILKFNVSTSLIFLISEYALQLFYEFGDTNGVNRHRTIKILYEKDNYIIFNSNKFQMETFSVYILNNQYYMSKKIEIQLKHLIPEYDFKILSYLIQIEIIEYAFQDLIFEADLIFCFEYLLCQRMNLQINFNNEQLESQATSIIRYPNLDYKIKEVMLLSYKYLIIQFQSLQKISYFYNLINKNALILDSFYQYVKDVEFQQYDQAQQIEITKIEKFVELKLINIQAYTILCQQKCLQGSEDILISNQVSNLQIQLYPKINEEGNIKLKFSLIIFNFITLLIYLKIRINKKVPGNQNKT